MSSRSSLERFHVGPKPMPGLQKGCGHYGGSGRFFGLDAEEMNPRGQVAASLAVLGPVALSGLLLVLFVPSLWWIFTTYFWVAFPAFGLLVRGIAGLSDQKTQATIAHSTGEKELLEALQREGQLTPVWAAMETSLSVAEAETILKELAEAGHLEARVRGGTISYALWDVRREIERRSEGGTT